MGWECPLGGPRGCPLGGCGRGGSVLVEASAALAAEVARVDHPAQEYRRSVVGFAELGVERLGD